MNEHLELQAGDILRFPQNEHNQLFDCPLDDGLGAGDLLYRRVVCMRSDGWYLTVGFFPDDGKMANWDCRYLSQQYIDRFAKKLVRLSIPSAGRTRDEAWSHHHRRKPRSGGANMARS